MSDTTFLPIGTLLARQYTILEHIGAGGFGKTYLVEDRLGAKKVVKEFFISSMCTRDAATRSVTVSVDENKEAFQQQLEKFCEEARRIYSFSHPNIVKVSALFDENDTAYYVMDYVDGESLAQKRKKTPLTEPQIMRYLDQLLFALDYIHSRGITHLDIKPGNIMIDKNDNVVLIDFGASKLFNSQSVNKTMMSSMRPPFTPGYAPLEQENGNVKDMGPHCDIYALGATLYNLYTGETPISPFDILQNGFPAMSNVSGQMQELIKRAMAPMVKDRMKSVSEFRAMLADNFDTNCSNDDNTKIADTQTSSNETKISQPTQSTKITEQKTETVNEIPKQPAKQETSTFETENKQKKKKRWPILIGIIIVIVLVAALAVVFINSKDKSAEPINYENNTITAPGTDIINYDKSAESINYENNTITVPGTDISYEMIKVEGGTFKMGAQSSDPNGENYDSESIFLERPVHSVTLDYYYIGETEVTQELWEAVMGTNPSYFKGSNKPVESVSWNDCQEFITKLNQLTGKEFRLPTEAEWEYAARGGNKSLGYKYAGSNTIGDVAWYEVNAYDVGRSHPVGTKSPNELGLYDMSGNVYEWCSDWYGEYSSSSQTNPTGPTSSEYPYRVLRGGSWGYDARVCRVSFRINNSPDDRNFFNGFRLALRP